MGDWIGTLLATNNPKLRASTSQQGSADVVSDNQNPAVICQFTHFLWGGGVIELTPHVRVTFHPIKEVIKGIKKR